MASLPLKVFKNHMVFAVRNIGSGHGVTGWWLDYVVLEVFSRLNDSIILYAHQFPIAVPVQQKLYNHFHIGKL